MNGISRAVSTGVAGLSMSAGRVVDFKFLDQQSLLLLWANPGKSSSHAGGRLYINSRQTLPFCY